MELALDPERARKIRKARNPVEQDVCSMCGEFCAIDMVNRYMKAGCNGA
jgi:phosphomethylpyrimidine synthase